MCSHGESFAGVRSDTRSTETGFDQGKRMSANHGGRFAVALQARGQQFESACSHPQSCGRASERSSSRMEHPARRRSPTDDHLDFVHGVTVLLNALASASTCALHQGLISVGAENNSVLIFSELMDSESCSSPPMRSLCISLASSINPIGRRSWRRLRRHPPSSTTCGDSGSSTSACRDRAEARVPGSCWSGRAHDGCPAGHRGSCHARPHVAVLMLGVR
jgi:hypothetical protein